jgi:hypothetical protein
MNILTNGGTNDTLDPLTTILKLYVLSFKDNGAKISICNNTLIINENGLIQGLTRSLYYKAVKNDIDLLTMPVLYACEKYILSNRPTIEQLLINDETMEVLDTNLLENSSTNEKTKKHKKIKKEIASTNIVDEGIQKTTIEAKSERTSDIIDYDLSDPYQKYIYLFTHAIEGLVTLKQAYKGDKITHTIDKHSNTMKDYLQNNINNSSVLSSGSGALKKLFYDSISEVWTKERLSIVFQLINQIKSDERHRLHTVKSLEAFLCYIDLCVNDIITGLT